MSSAELVLKYAHLAGKFIRAERPMTEVESLENRAMGGDGKTFGGEGFVAMIEREDRLVGGPGVSLMFDYGIGVTIFADAEDEWSITVWPDQPARMQFASGPQRQSPRYSRWLTERVADAMSDSLTMLGVNVNEAYEGDSRTCGEILAEIAIEAGLR